MGVVIQTGGSSLRRAVGVEQQHPNETDISSTPPWKASKAGGLRIRKWFIHRAPGGGYNRNFHNFLTTQVGLYVYPATRVIWYGIGVQSSAQLDPFAGVGAFAGVGS